MRILLRCVLAGLLALTPMISLADSCGKLPDSMDPGAKGLADQLSDQNPSDGTAMLFCYTAAAIKSPQAAFLNCGCKKVVKESCKFGFKNGVLKVRGLNGAKDAWCEPFKFLAL